MKKDHAISKNSVNISDPFIIYLYVPWVDRKTRVNLNKIF